MIEYINRERVRRAIRKVVACVTCPMHIAAGIYQELDFIPAEDAAPVVHGRWINIENKTAIKCSACSHIFDRNIYGFGYCPVCGAKMDMGGGEE